MPGFTQHSNDVPDLDGLFRPEVVIVAGAADTEALARTRRWVERWATEVGAKVLPAEAAEGSRVDVAVLVGEEGLAAAERLGAHVRFAVLQREPPAHDEPQPTEPPNPSPGPRALAGATPNGPTQTEHGAPAPGATLTERGARALGGAALSVPTQTEHGTAAPGRARPIPPTQTEHGAPTPSGTRPTGPTQTERGTPTPDATRPTGPPQTQHGTPTPGKARPITPTQTEHSAPAPGGTHPTGPTQTEHGARFLGGARLVGPGEAEVYEVVGGLRERRGGSPGVGLVARYPWQLHLLGGALRKAGVPVPYRLATGDEADVTVPEVITYLAGRPDVGAIACHLDAVRDGQALCRALDLAARRAVPVVTYTPAPDPVLAAALRQFGVIRVDRPDQLQDTAALLAHTRRPPGAPPPPGTVAVYAPHAPATGGYMTDAAKAAGLTVIEAASPAEALADPEVGVLVLASPCAAQDRATTTTTKAVCAVADQWPPAATPLTPTLRTPANCAAAVRAYLDHARFATHYRPPSTAPSPSLRKARALLDLEPPSTGPHRRLTAHATKQLLRAYGIRVPREQLVTSAAAAVRAAARVGHPVVLKACAPEGGSRVGLTSAGQVREAYRDMAATARRTGVPLDGVVVAQLIDGGVELAVSVTRDPRFGPVVTVRPAGDLAALADAAVRVAPFDEPAARELLHELRAGPLLAALDADALVDTLLRLQRLAVELADDLTELHVAPLAVRGRGRGTAALDATAARTTRTAEAGAALP